MNSSNECLSCGSRQLEPILNLGKTPLANSLVSEQEVDAPTKTFPLEVQFCKDCTLLQLRDLIPPQDLFSNYLYFSSFSQTMLESSVDLATALIEDRRLNSESLVVEVASNDGYLLSNYVRNGIPVLGIEPAINIAEVANKNGVKTINNFFDSELALQLAADNVKADIIHANNVLAHVPNINSFVKGLATILKDEGSIVIEVPYLRDLIEKVAFDTIYHEHVFYFSLKSLDCLFRRHKLIIENLERLTIHGGSLRLYITHDKGQESSQVVQTLLQEEQNLGYDKKEFYLNFQEQVRALGEELKSLLEKLKRDGKSIVGYGASAKGSTLLNFFEIGSQHLDYIVDRSTYKQGLYTPGTHLKITSVDKLSQLKPEYVLLLSWNFKEEILLQQDEYLQLGGSFIIPIPRVEIYSKESRNYDKKITASAA
jgi:SAM-dependent methyltransferase